MAQTRSGGQSLITIETSESEKDPSKKSEKKKSERTFVYWEQLFLFFFLVFESFSDPIETRETFVKAIHHW